MDSLFYLISLVSHFPDFLNEHVLTKLIVFTVLGSIVGQFVNVVVYRLPKVLNDTLLVDTAEQFPQLISESQLLNQLSGISLWVGYGDSCLDQNQSWYRKLPILNWFFHLTAGDSVSTNKARRKVWIEAGTTCLFGVVSVLYQNPINSALIAAIGTVLVIVSLIDIETKFIPPVLLVILLILLITAWDSHLFLTDPSFFSLLCSAIFVWAALEVINQFFNHFSGFPVVGGGDIKLLSVLSLALGIENTLYIFFISVLLSTVYCHLKKIQGITSLGQWISGTAFVVLLTVTSDYSFVI